MKPIRPEDIPQSMVDLMSPEERKELGLSSSSEDAERRAKATAKRERDDEKKIQQTVEAYLVQLGYERRTPDNIARGEPRSGWFIHLNETKKNPILGDLLILSTLRERRYCELELKTLSGRLTDEQQNLVDQGMSLARGADAAMRIIKEWHQSLL